MTSAAVFFIREASSPTVISSGILTVSGVFLMTAPCCRRRIFSCSSLRGLVALDELVARFLFCCCLALLPMRCLPPGVILHPLGDQGVHPVVKPVSS